MLSRACCFTAPSGGDFSAPPHPFSDGKNSGQSGGGVEDRVIDGRRSQREKTVDPSDRAPLDSEFRRSTPEKRLDGRFLRPRFQSTTGGRTNENFSDVFRYRAVFDHRRTADTVVWVEGVRGVREFRVESEW